MTTETNLTLEQHPFDYSLVTADLADTLRARGQRIREIKDKAAVDLGRELTAAQDELADHVDGTFQKWIEAETGMSKTTAYNLINVFKRFGSRPNFGQLNISLSAQYVLAAPSVPDEVIEEVIGRAESGESITHAAAKDAVTPTVTDDTRAKMRAILADGPLHRNIIESRARDANLDSRSVAATLQVMLSDRQVQRIGLMYALPELPETTRTSENAQRIYDALVNRGAPYQAVRTCNLLDLDMTDFTRAVNLLEAQGRIRKYKDTPGSPTMLDAIIPAPDAAPADESPAGEAAATDPNVTGESDEDDGRSEIKSAFELSERVIEQLLPQQDGLTYQQIRDSLGIKPTDPAVQTLRAALDTLFGQQRITKVSQNRITLTRKGLREAESPDPDDDQIGPDVDRAVAEMNAHFDKDAITLTGRTDDGAWHRAIEIGRRLVAAGVWDGQAKIEFDAYRVHDLLFGVNPILLTGPDDQFGTTGIYFPEVYNLTGQAHVEWVKRQRHQSIESIINSACTWGKEDLEALLEAESEHTNRASLVKWLKGRLENALPAEMLDGLDWADRRALNDLPPAQREMLVAVYRDQPVVHNAATRIALINRGLLANGGEDWWADIQMTDQGRRLAALLNEVMPVVTPETAPAADTFSPLRDQVLETLRSGAASLKVIGQTIAHRTGQTILEETLVTVMNELLVDGLITLLDFDGDNQKPRYMLVESAAVTSAPTPKPAAEPHKPLPVSVDTARELIIDALRKSQRPLGHGELCKYAGLLEQRPVFEQAFDAMCKAGSLASVYDPGFGHRYHFPDVLEKMTAPKDDNATAPAHDPTADAFETALINAASAINLALKAAAPDFAALPDDRRTALHDLMREVHIAAGHLCADLLNLSEYSKD